jgi:hypothetical protein
VGSQWALQNVLERLKNAELYLASGNLFYCPTIARIFRSTLACIAACILTRPVQEASTSQFF